MFPGMFGGGPEPLPEHKAQEQFWGQLNNFLLFTTVATVVSTLIKHVELRAHDALTGSS